MLTEAGSKKRARVGVYSAEAMEAELAHLGPEAYGIGVDRLGEILAAEPRRLHPLLRDQRAVAGIGRAWSNEILNRARLSPYALSTELSPGRVERLAEAVDAELERGLELRERGVPDAKIYRVHDRLGQPCPHCATPLARIDFEEHTIFYCPSLPDSGPRLGGPLAPRLLR